MDAIIVANGTAEEIAADSPCKPATPQPSRMEQMKCDGEWPNLQWDGTLECMDYAAAIMFELGNYLMVSDKKVRVTIERDPEAGRFWVKREELN